MKTGWAIAVSLLIVAAPALAQDLTATVTNDKPAKPPKKKKVCRLEKWTGTRVARPTCASEEEWAEYDREQAAEAKEVLKKVADNGRVMPQGLANPPQMGPNGFSN